jgi:hypothetical protein
MLAASASASLSSDLVVEFGEGKPIECSSMSEARQQPSRVENLGTDAQCSTSRRKVGFYFFARLQESTGLNVNQMHVQVINQLSSK